MKKIISLILCIASLVTFSVPALAVDDAAVNYVISIEASNPDNGDSYSIGQTVTLTVCVKDIVGTQTPPIYGLNGALKYDSYVLKLTDVRAVSPLNSLDIRVDVSSGRVAFSYLCAIVGSELKGTPVDAEFGVITFTFEALNDGISKISLSDFVITNSDASERYISSIESVKNIKVGSGEMIGNADTLKAAINDAKAQLGAAVLGSSANLVYPAFTVTQSAYDALAAAIKKAETALSAATNQNEFMAAQKELNMAIYSYESSKMYGYKTDGSVDEPEVENELIEVSAIAGENGKIVAGYESQLVRKGTSVTVMAAPDNGYAVEKVIVNGVEYSGDTIVTIANVTNKTVVEFKFAKLPRFTDVAKGAWYFDSVEKIVEMGLFAGTSDTQFSPDAPMTRAMLVTVLHRLEGKNAPKKAAAFADVPAGQWYSDAIAWASENGIVNGYDANTFGTNDNVSRQDMVTILYRYLAYKGITPVEGVSLDSFADADAVSGYARPALEWAYAAGLVKGTSDTTLSPRDNSTRAQVATVILRYVENVK